MGHPADRRPRPARILFAVLAVVAAVGALMIDCGTAQHDDHHGTGVGAGLVAVVADGAGHLPDLPLPDHCVAGVPGPADGLILPVLALLGAIAVVLVTGLGALPATGRGPPRSAPRSRGGRIVLTQFCICRR
ncbi:putative copper homeostasis (lipo)protein LpqS [Nocardia rhizosphaerae]|uniref:Lipoprotein LpqS n=1 Tax=Nocardia rhizosphaerae TaxID=1691571 RepID=A0ABV8LEJ4_9NOCA